MIRITRAAFAFAASCLIVSSAFAANVSGKISYKGAPPAKQMIKMEADKSCLKMHGGKDVPAEQTVVNSNGTLRWVFVYVKNAPAGKYPAPAEHVTIDQKECMYHPHVFGMQTGQQLDILNSDPVIHNIHALPKNSAQFNIGQPKKGQKNTKTFDKEEVMVRVKCDVHPWMAAWVGVLPHPFFAVTDDNGNFTIKNLPAGEYDLVAWHEKLGTQNLHVKVGSSDTKNADITFAAK